MWSQTSLPALVVLVAVLLVILALMLALTWWLPRRLGFNRADAIAIQFVWTKKSLASGLPMAASCSQGRRWDC